MPEIPEVPFSIRILVLVAVLAVSALIDRWRYGSEANRWREYSFLLGAAVLGGVFAALNDQISLALSPEFFEFGKGIERDADFHLNVTALGFHAGFLGGAVLGGVLLLFNQGKPDRPALPFKALWLRTPWILASAVLFGVLGLLLFWAFGLGTEVTSVMSEQAAAGFHRVQGLHSGLYAGALIGLVIAVLRVRRARQRVSSASIAPESLPVTSPTNTPSGP